MRGNSNPFRQLASAAMLVALAAAAGPAAADIAETGNTDATAGGAQALADRVVVRKSERKLYLLKDDEVLRVHDIRLGKQPLGHKVEEGDLRTPEGAYRLGRRNPRSSFFLSIQVSYPNDNDRAAARDRGVAPGGAIMIHGQPNSPLYSRAYYASRDWTDGCIAVSDAAMIDIWMLTRAGTPVEILP